MGERKAFAVTIEKLTHGGRGLGFIDGKAVFVPLSAPGDRILCRPLAVKKRHIEAEPVEILERAVLRRSPPCPLFGSCGGCQWQHLPSAEQALWKERIFAGLFAKNSISADLEPIVPADTEFHYRNRVQFKCRLTAAGFVIGFYRSGSHFVVDVERCLLLRPELQEVLAQLRARMPESPCPEGVPQIDVSCGDDRAVQLVVHLLPSAVAPMSDWLRELACRYNWTLSVQSGRKDSLCRLSGRADQRLDLTPYGLRLQVGPGGFAQINPLQNLALIDTVCRYAGLTGAERVLDLFCGAGNFSLPLAQQAAWLDGVEFYAPAIADARSNAEANRIANVAFHAGDALERCAHLLQENTYDLVVLDPPRTGCYDLVRRLVAAQPERIIYVSCDPATLVRDLQPLLHRGYRLEASRPFDLFPQTWHIESVTLLRRQ